MKPNLLISTALLLVTSPIFAANSAPQPVPFVDTIPAPQDIAYPGTISLKIDATNTDQAIFKVEEAIPVAQTGAITLLFPKWLPGEHGPRGEIEKLAGLKISVDGQPVEWTRDVADVCAFHINVPAGAKLITAKFQFLSATAEDQGRIQMTPEMLSLEYAQLSLYPAGYFVRRIPVSAQVTYPTGWKAASALRPVSTAGDTVSYETVPYDVLVDSPAIAGRTFRAEALSPTVTLDMVADSPANLEIKPAQLEAHKKLAEQAVKTFGAQHYDHYDFLFSLSDTLGGIGLEHHRSSEDGVKANYFTDWDLGPGDRNLLPHEFSHSWDGKFRRGFDLWTPDYRTPMRDSLLWVYEGQTQFWGYVLGARSGIYSKQDTLDSYAAIAATLDIRRGRDWRALQDTTNDPIITARAPKGWVSYQRSEDYYNEGMLVWIETDAKLRAMTGGKKGIDDFAKLFFGVNDGDYGELTYDFETIAKTLNQVAPYDWAGFLRERLDGHAKGAPLGGFEASGYKLVYTDKPTPAIKDGERRRKALNLTYGLGVTVKGADGAITEVIWDSPAFNAGLAIGNKIVAVNGRVWSDETGKQAIAEAATSKTPLQFVIKSGDRVRTIAIPYTGGLRYPHFVKTGGDKAADGPLDLLLKPRP
jgi:predicted metalloprotease with PDZ domain